jgi:hypothetical protein
MTIKTMTLGPGDGPTYTICPGHVDIEAFKKAFVAEGWSAPPDISDQDLSFEWWINRNTYWEVSHRRNPHAEPVTVMDW